MLTLSLRDSEIHLELGSDTTQLQRQQLHCSFTTSTECLCREWVSVITTMTQRTQIFALERNSLYLDHSLLTVCTFITDCRKWTLFVSCSGKFSPVTNRNLGRSLAWTQTSGNTSTNKTNGSSRCKHSIIECMLGDTVLTSY